MTAATKNTIHKLETLPDSMVYEVEDFIDFLKAKHAKSFPKSGSNEVKLVEEPKSLYGAAKGLFIIPKDFNEPLDFS
ncbi:DUF2281 domain-containing protein [Pedobacter sp. HDW13]|uniref:DUF2281 domain-containing protein n=1 Tax=unclassified Pedobacter TaxID=2628915 RepID=UPI000F598801|nr:MULTISPECIES: DUF2281 domain-containing protein [unclassified Pedobacter]QIL38677.1 DUF2281 domain-containing protein [Pedobacter sp. HDW13]RQO80160.1 hypothetical protein DBR40_00645 [Pedobacter sp. KBW01]